MLPHVTPRDKPVQVFKPHHSEDAQSARESIERLWTLVQEFNITRDEETFDAVFDVVQSARYEVFKLIETNSSLRNHDPLA